MRSWKSLLIAATVCGAVTTAYALPAQAMGWFKSEWANFHGGGKPGGKPGGGHGGPSHGGGGGGNKGVPGPIAGAGLPFLLLAGGYVLVRRYRNRSMAQ
ncbi:hypothetical protein AAII07_56395 [Microvirga sp. 0TCS3.31]